MVNAVLQALVLDFENLPVFLGRSKVQNASRSVTDFPQRLHPATSPATAVLGLGSLVRATLCPPFVHLGLHDCRPKTRTTPAGRGTNLHGYPSAPDIRQRWASDGPRSRL